MSEIRTTKIDGVEFVTYKDYLRLKEEKEKMQEEIKILKQSIMQDEWGIIQKLEEENKNLKSDLEQFSEAYKRYRDYEKEELAESCYDLARENQKLKEKLEQIKETYIRFEDSEKEYNKGLGELDQLIMNR